MRSDSETRFFKRSNPDPRFSFFKAQVQCRFFMPLIDLKTHLRIDEVYKEKDKVSEKNYYKCILLFLIFTATENCIPNFHLLETIRDP